jgi:hypothetical protein
MPHPKTANADSSHGSGSVWLLDCGGGYFSWEAIAPDLHGSRQQSFAVANVNASRVRGARHFSIVDCETYRKLSVESRRCCWARVALRHGRHPLKPKVCSVRPEEATTAKISTPMQTVCAARITSVGEGGPEKSSKSLSERLQPPAVFSCIGPAKSGYALTSYM